VTSFGPRPPDCVGKHSTKSRDVRQNVGFSANKMIEVVGGRGS
jgi:hypothetical protein